MPGPKQRNTQTRFRKSASPGLAVALVPFAVVLAAILAAPQVNADHNDLETICPAPIVEGENGEFKVRWRGNTGIGVTVFTYHGSHTASANDFIGYDRVYMKGSSDSDTLSVPVETREDSAAEYDETFKIGFWVSGLWHGCVVTIEDDDSPVVQRVQLTSSPTVGDTYRTHEVIEFTLTFDQNVVVSGDVALEFEMGGAGLLAGDREASYQSGSGGAELVFQYQVAPADVDANGVRLYAGAIDADRQLTGGFAGTGQIVAEGSTVRAKAIHAGIDPSTDHLVDGRPYVKEIRMVSTPPDPWTAYRANQIFEFDMVYNTDVDVSGDARVRIYVGYDGGYRAASLRHARYQRGSGTNLLRFAYTIAPGDDDHRGPMIGYGDPADGFHGSGDIVAAGTSVGHNPWFSGSGRLTEHLIDTRPANLRSVTIASQPSDGIAYRVGEIVRVAAEFSEPVTYSGDLEVELEIGQATRRASFSAGGSAPEQALFAYTIAAGDFDGDGIGIGANSLRLNGGSIRDQAGNHASVSHDVVAATSSQRVDASSSAIHARFVR